MTARTPSVASSPCPGPTFAAAWTRGACVPLSFESEPVPVEPCPSSEPGAELPLTAGAAMISPVAGSTWPPVVPPLPLPLCAPVVLPEPVPPVLFVVVFVPVFVLEPVVEPVVDPVVDPLVVFVVDPVVVVADPVPLLAEALAEADALLDADGVGLAAPLVPHGPAPCLSHA